MFFNEKFARVRCITARFEIRHVARERLLLAFLKQLFLLLFEKPRYVFVGGRKKIIFFSLEIWIFYKNIPHDCGRFVVGEVSAVIGGGYFARAERLLRFEHYQLAYFGERHRLRHLAAPFAHLDKPGCDSRLIGLFRYVRLFAINYFTRRNIGYFIFFGHDTEIFFFPSGRAYRFDAQNIA
ncbi:MAG: hypothetical protein BWY32_02947 [bacterium ADurb.Bin243]|nr:MAG: hypothetical protein BWY32_02947 [bacterium ADurb.Bin243]